MRMVEDYSDVDGEEDLEALEAYWVKEFGLASPRLEGPFEEDTLEQGAEIHEYNCEFCHSPPQYAPGGYLVSGIIRPVASPLDKAGMDIPVTEYPLVSDVLEHIIELYPDLNLSGENAIITVNGEVTSPDRKLQDGDTVMFLPAIGGG